LRNLPEQTSGSGDAPELSSEANGIEALQVISLKLQAYHLKFLKSERNLKS